MTMKEYLSFGGGVNSTALLLLLLEQKKDFKAIFVNHGGDYPRTYEYIDYLRSEGFDIQEILPDVKGHSTIYDHCIANRIVPSRRFRWCTDKFKIRPIREHIETPCTMYIGLDSSEERRIKSMSSKNEREGITNEYPLMKASMDRADCVELIKSHDLEIPEKSGCWFCPFMRVAEIRELHQSFPDLFTKAVYLENNCRRSDIYIKDKPLTAFIA